MKKLMLSLVAACAAAVSFGEILEPTLFTKKCDFTVSGYAGSSTLEDFPVLVRLSEGSPVGFSYDDCAAGGADLRFTDVVGNLVPHEIETWNTEGESLVWVKVPTLVGTATTITAYFGANPAQLPAVDIHDTWTKYVTVIHGGTTIADSSVKKLTLTANDVTGTGDGGFIGGGMNKASKNSKGVNVPSPYKNGLFTNDRQYSISFWAKSPTKSDDGTHVTVCGVTGWNQASFLGLFEKGHGWSVAVSGTHHYSEGKGKLPKDTWMHTAFSYNTEAGHLISYSDGDEIYNNASVNKYTDTGVDYWTFGGYANTANNDNFYGDLDECRIYDGIASADWFKAEYDSMHNSSFVVGGTVQPIEIPSNPTIACVTSEVTMYTLGINITVTGFGKGGSGCDLHAVLASDPAYETVLSSLDKTSGEVELGTAYPIGAENLNFGTAYYLKVEATNDKGEKTTVEKTFETLPAPACEVTFAQEKGGSTLGSFFWSLSDFGDMSSYASVAVEWATDSAFTNPSSQGIVDYLDSPTNETRVVVRGLAPSTQYYIRLKTVNECGTVGYSKVIKVMTTATEQNRIWANTGTDMNDPASYVENLLPGDGDTIYFTEPVKVQPYLTSSLTVKGVFFGRYDKERTFAETDPTGYVITGAEGAKLTLTGTGGTDYAVNSATTAGEAEINVPIVLSGNNPHLGANGMRINLSGAISTTKEYQQDVQTVTSGADEPHIGYLVFSAANPDFKPSQIHWSSGRFEYAHPQSLMSVKKILSGNWGGYLPYVYNTSGEPMVMDALEKISGESYGLNQLTFEGAPFIMTNCDFAVCQRDSKARYFNAAVSFKSVGAWDYSGSYFSKYGTNMLETLEAYHEEPNTIGHVQVIQGMFYPHKLLETVARADRRFRINGDGVNPNNGGVYPTLGVDQDARIPVSDLGGISFGKDGETKPAGLSGMGGEVSVTLTDTSDTPLELVYGQKAPGDKGYILPSIFAFGNPSATGTVILENDITRTGGQYEMWAFQGKADVTARYRGHLTVTGGNFIKSGTGSVAIEGPVTMDSGKQVQANGGGLLINTDLSEIAGDIRLNNDAWIGGTGVVAHIHKESGNAYSAIRPGEFGKGTLTVKGTKGSKFADKTGFIVDITAAGTTGLLKLEGEGSTYDMNRSGYWMRIEPQEGAPAGKYKIMDWSGMEGTPSGKWISADGFTVQYDETKVKKAELVVEDKAMYLKFRPVTKGGMYLIIK